MAQAVSDLSAADAPSLALWNQLSVGYNACEVVCIGTQGWNPKVAAQRLAGRTVQDKQLDRAVRRQSGKREHH
ncbi:MAG: hypothetical protein ACLU3I_17360 [Acutalibacteraceae bacterium]